MTGTSVGTVTDADGNFTLSVPAGQKELKVSYIGMDDKTVRIQGTPPGQDHHRDGRHLHHLPSRQLRVPDSGCRD